MKVASLRTRRRWNNVCSAIAIANGVIGAVRFVVTDSYFEGCAWLVYAVVLLTLNIDIRPPKGPTS